MFNLVNKLPLICGRRTGQQNSSSSREVQPGITSMGTCDCCWL